MDTPFGPSLPPYLHPVPNEFGSKRIRPERKCSMDAAFIGHRSTMVVTPQNRSGISAALHVSRGGAALLIVQTVQHGAVRRRQSLFPGSRSRLPMNTAPETPPQMVRTAPTPSPKPCACQGEYPHRARAVSGI